jgi:hypothetical protein
MNCKLCDATLGDPPGNDTRLTQVCFKCRDKLGIVGLPPSRRKAKPCAHCQGMKFVRVVPRELSAGGSDYVAREAAPMTATIAPEVSPKLIFSGNSVSSAQVNQGVGRLEMYICQGCGFVEWFCQDPENIPIGTEYMSEAIDYSSETPYR